jgi:hypothetical protein
MSVKRRISVQEFRDNFNRSTECAVEFGSKFVTNKISENITYDIEYNCGYDEASVGYDTFKEDDQRIDQNLQFEEVVQRLHRNSKFPVWIDISLIKFSKSNTRVNLRCAGRYSDWIDDLYTRHEVVWA